MQHALLLKCDDHKKFSKMVSYLLLVCLYISLLFLSVKQRVFCLLLSTLLRINLQECLVLDNK